MEGERVSEIRILDDSGKSVGRETGSLPLRVGEPFDIAKERDTLRVLYRSGDYEDIHVAAESTEKGLRVDFLVRRNFFNNAIRVEGLKEPPSEPAAWGMLLSLFTATSTEIAARSVRSGSAST